MNRGKTKRILVVVVKWRHPANGLLTSLVIKDLLYGQKENFSLWGQRGKSWAGVSARVANQNAGLASSYPLADSAIAASNWTGPVWFSLSLLLFESKYRRNNNTWKRVRLPFNNNKDFIPHSSDRTQLINYRYKKSEKTFPFLSF